MPRHDNYSNFKAVAGMTPNVVNDDTDGTGAIVDLRGFESATLLVHVGDSGDTLSVSVYHTLTLEHGDDSGLSDAAAVPVADMIGEAGTTAGEFAIIDAPTEDTLVVKVGYNGGKRYVRFKDDTTGTHTNGTPMSAVWVLGGDNDCRTQPDGATPG